MLRNCNNFYSGQIKTCMKNSFNNVRFKSMITLDNSQNNSNTNMDKLDILQRNRFAL